MPNLNLYLLRGRDPATKRRLMREITAVVVDAFGAPADNVRVFLLELDAEQIFIGGEPISERASAAADLAGPTVHAFLIEGRSEMQKERLIVGLSKTIAEVLNIPLAPIRIMIMDVANTNFGFNGQTAKALGR